MLKRTIDIVVSALGLLVVAPLFAAIAVWIKLDSSGPVFYLGLRTGQGGKPFRIFKFRSMTINAERTGGTTTGKDDLRITAAGRVLRKYKLDELPQLINILRGEMSLVGPRPEVAEYTDHYTDEEQLILTVRPGITDLSSLEFHDLQEVVGDRDPDKVFRDHVLPRKNALRLKYVREQSLLEDLRILLCTLWVVASKPIRRRT